MPNKTAVVLLSGGMDSSVLLAQTLFEDFDVIPVTIYYGQRHSREIRAAKDIVDFYGLGARWHQISVPGDILASPFSSQTSDLQVPEGAYDDESMKQTVVPNRNMFLLSIGVARAIVVGAEQIRYAAHAGDHAIYPDCRPDFVQAMQVAITRCDWRPPTLIAPFIASSKADIVERGHQLRVPFELTWTCYKGGDEACGRCGTCVERLEAFALSGHTDPLKYTDYTFWQEAVRR